MVLTNISGQHQPYKSWKGPSTYAAVPGWSRPLLPADDNKRQGPGGSSNTSKTKRGPKKRRGPNPIKHWRKQLHPNNVSSSSTRSAVGMPMDIPGGSVYLGINGGCNGEAETVNIATTKNNIFDYTGTAIGPNESTVCLACNPEKHIIRSGMTEKRINPINSTVEPTKKYSFSTKEYLRSKNKTYAQRLTGSKISGIDYNKQYSNKSDGSQIRKSLTCLDPAETCNIIYKPNNREFSTQGAVSSSSRLDNLKLKTINKSANNLKKWGNAAANASAYNGNFNSPYTIKSKNNICSSNIYHRNGDKQLKC